jgi:hypothetical protein
MSHQLNAYKRYRNASPASNERPLNNGTRLAAASNGTDTQLLTRGQIPSRDKVINILMSLTRSLVGEASMPSANLLTPPLLCAEGLSSNLDDPMVARLRWNDLQTKEVKTGSINRLLALLSADHMRAIGLPPPLHFRHGNSTCHIDTSNPGLPKLEGRNTNLVASCDNFYSATLTSSITPVYIVKSIDDITPVRSELNHVGYPLIPHDQHNNDCMCPLLVINNNYQAINFVRICVPVPIRRTYPEDPTLLSSVDQHRKGPRHTNTSFTYYSPISYCGTSLPQLINRTSYGNVERETPTFYSPPFASINLNSNPKVRKALFAQIDRPDLSKFTARLADQPSPPSTLGHTRFFPTSMFNTNEDILAYGPDLSSLETVILNSVLIEPFKGPRSCPYCKEIVDLMDAIDLQDHMLTAHKILLDLNFSCPACLKVSIFNKDTYLPHFRSKHAGTLSLMTVLNETHIHARLQLGHILALMINMATHLQAPPTAIPGAPLHYASPIGGFTSNSPDLLKQEIETQQQQQLPPTIRAMEAAAIPPYRQPVVPQPTSRHVQRPARTNSRDPRLAPRTPQTDRRPMPSTSRAPHSIEEFNAMNITDPAAAIAIANSMDGYYTREYQRTKYEEHTENRRRRRSPSQTPPPYRRHSPSPPRHNRRHPFSRTHTPSPAMDLDNMDDSILDEPDEDMVPPARFNTAPPSNAVPSPSIDEIISMQN